MITVTSFLLPIVSKSNKLYMTSILNDNSLIQPVIVELKVLYGNVNIIGNDIYIPIDNQFYSLLVKGTYNNIDYYNVYYNKAIYGNILPNNVTKITQKLPKGVFKDLTENSVIGKIISAISQMYGDYYKNYFNLKDKLLGTNYSPELEYEYNYTQGLLSTSAYPNELFKLLIQTKQYAVNVYQIELYLSKYIYYRLNISCAIYISDGFNVIIPYWMLSSPTNSQLNVSTKLAPSGYQQSSNIKYYIYNSNTFTNDFRNEIINLIERVTRVDIGFDIIFETIDPIDDNFTLIGPTYLTDPRTINNRCIKYIGDNDYPLNVIGYTK